MQWNNPASWSKWHNNIYGPSLLGAEFVRGRVCQGPSLSGAEMSRNPSWQCFTIFCDIQQELIILAGTDKCLTSLKMNSIHFEGRRSLQTTKKNVWLTPLHAMSVLTFDSPGSKFRSRCYTVFMIRFIRTIPSTLENNRATCLTILRNACPDPLENHMVKLQMPKYANYFRTGANMCPPEMRNVQGKHNSFIYSGEKV